MTTDARYVVKSGDLYCNGHGGWGPRAEAYVFAENGSPMEPRERAEGCVEAWRNPTPRSFDRDLTTRPDARVVRLFKRGITRVYEVTYALRFYGGGGKPTGDYAAASGLFAARRDAARFLTPNEARASQHPFTLYGAGGPDDTCGWKVVRLLRRIA